LAQKDISQLYWYVLCVLIQIAAFYYVGSNPVKSLLIFGLLGVVSMLVGMMSSGMVAVYAFLSGGLFCSILWPCIFSLSIAGLGNYTSQGSAFLIMMILGGGIIPPLQGKLSDILGIQTSYFVAVLCFAYLAAFALIVRKTLLNQGVQIEEQEASLGH
jgi:FHS family L-fucose permease-like MFS transporter